MLPVRDHPEPPLLVFRQANQGLVDAGQVGGPVIGLGQAHAGQQGADFQLPAAHPHGQHGLDPRRDAGGVDDLLERRQRDHDGRAAGYALPGTLTVRAYACGKPNCRCHADPPRLHGPYAEWTRKTITRRLTPAELAEYQPLFDDARKLRAPLSELQDLTLEIIEPGGSQEPHDPQPEPPAPENVG